MKCFDFPRINPGIVVEMGEPGWDEGYFEQAGCRRWLGRASQRSIDG